MSEKLESIVQFYIEHYMQINFYLLIFLFVIAICYFISDLYRHKNIYAVGMSIILLTVVFIFLFIFSGWRYDVGVDFDSYYNSFYRTIDYLRNTNGYEEGYVQLISLLKKYTDTPQSIIISTSFIYICLIYYYIMTNKKILQNLWLFMIVFILSWQFMYSFNVVRSCIAGAILYLSYKYILNRNFIKFLIVVVIASLFHRTALLFLFAYFMNNKIYKTPKAKLIFLLSVILVISGKHILPIILNLFTSNRMASYSNSIYANTTRNIFAIIPFMLKIPIYLLATNKLTRKQQEDTENTFYFNMYFISLNLNLLTIVFELVWRINIYFWPAEYFVVQSYINNSKNKLIATITCIFIYLLTFYIYVYLDPGVLPYQSILFK